MNNLQKWNEIQNRAQAKAVANLDDAYVKKKIARGELSHTLIPKSLVELKRVQLAIHRHIKEANQE